MAICNGAFQRIEALIDNDAWGYGYSGGKVSAADHKGYSAASAVFLTLDDAQAWLAGVRSAITDNAGYEEWVLEMDSGNYHEPLYTAAFRAGDVLCAAPCECEMSNEGRRSINDQLGAKGLAPIVRA